MKIFLFACFLIFVASITFAFRVHNPPMDMLDVNSAIQYVQTHYPHTPANFIPAQESLHEHIQGRYTIVPVFIGAQMVGSLYYENDLYTQLQNTRVQFLMIFYMAMGGLALAIGVFVLYYHKTITIPFGKLEKFATAVAAGNLDAPLTMDEGNIFGAFTESFDLMRTELGIARENERQANISKKELVATLSHDIKTPAAAIKIMAELATAKNGSSKELDTIVDKVNTIDRLISNMFSATLEELTQLKVAPTDVNTNELAEIIHRADFKNMLQPFTLPPCVLSLDPLRIGQVFDNIINNAYKYGGDAIVITGEINEGEFTLGIQDNGPGVDSEALPLLQEKFYRANNATGQSGAGLGLYLTSYFIKEMGGSIHFANHCGLLVRITLLLA